jgi:hypothetical protein
VVAEDQPVTALTAKFTAHSFFDYEKGAPVITATAHSDHEPPPLPFPR